MHAYINVASRTAGVSLHSGWGPGPHVKLIGATFPVVPTGTIVDKLALKVPDGLHALAFFCRVEGPHRMGSGKAIYLDHNPKISSKVLLAWEEDGKLLMKADDDMKAPELSKFNPFVRSDTNVLVVDTDRKVAYTSDLPPCKVVDPSWTYKAVSMDFILKYITKKLTMEELDQRATSEQRARDELRELRDQNRVLQNSVNNLAAKAGQLETDNSRLEKQRASAVASRDALIGTLMKSEGFHKLLKRLPTTFRPKSSFGFIEALDSVNKSTSA